MALDLEQTRLRQVLGRFATGVAVATCRDVGGKPQGITINSFSSVSLEPPLVLFSMARSSRRLADFLAAGRFAVNVLAADQQELSRRFAVSDDPWCGLACDQDNTEVPLIVGALAHFECRFETSHDGGDHVIIVGRVEALAERPGAPLVFWAGDYHRLVGATG
ncbi:MAG TPA: flavin reductase family protein [Alphaproteobacteria bacterium]|jgi:flavin reductase (DIM6/NTAB) family NADH-FMN oxidoreductase RutF|nr:flavin reductase family protein [Alphaproteobacteria bacterium]